MKKLLIPVLLALAACGSPEAPAPKEPEPVETKSEITYGERPGIYECGIYYADLSSIEIVQVNGGWKLKLHDLRTGRDVTMEQEMGRCQWIADKFDETFMRERWFFRPDQMEAVAMSYTSCSSTDNLVIRQGGTQ